MTPGPSRRFGRQTRPSNLTTANSARPKSSLPQADSIPRFSLNQELLGHVPQGDATRPLSPLDLGLAPFKIEDDGETSIFDDASVRELGPLACQTVNEDELEDVDGLPTRAQWKSIVEDYLASLHPTKRHKSLISQEFYRMIFRTLKAPDATRLGTPQFRFWARKMFQLVEAPNNVLVVTNGGRPVAIKEHIYDILCMCHLECSHGGRDKTCKILREYYTWVPKELISNFVKACPTCAPRKAVHSKSKDDKARPTSATIRECLPDPPPRFAVERLKDFGLLPSPPDESRQLRLPSPIEHSTSVLISQSENSENGFMSSGSASTKFHQSAPLPAWTGKSHVVLPPINIGAKKCDEILADNLAEGNKHSSLPPLMPYLSGRYEHNAHPEHSTEGHITPTTAPHVPIDPALLDDANQSNAILCACKHSQCSGCQSVTGRQHGNALHLEFRPATTLGTSHHNIHQLSINTSLCRSENAEAGPLQIAWQFPSVASMYSGTGDNSALLSASTASVGLPTPSGSGQISPMVSEHVPTFQYCSSGSESIPSFVGVMPDGRYGMCIGADDGFSGKTTLQLPHGGTPPLISPQPVKMDNTNAVIELTAAANE